MTPISVRDIVETYGYRRLLECFAAGRVAESASRLGVDLVDNFIQSAVGLAFHAICPSWGKVKWNAIRACLSGQNGVDLRRQYLHDLRLVHGRIRLGHAWRIFEIHALALNDVGSLLDLRVD